MSNVPWNPVPGWDVPRDFYAPDEPSANEESFDEMIEERMNMVPANEDEAQRGLNDTFKGMNEAEEAIRIADKHLNGETAQRRQALALDIHQAIMRHAAIIAAEVISEGLAKARETKA